MKKFLLSMVLAGLAVLGFSQNNVFIGSSGVVIGTYNSTSDVITANNSAINTYLQQKVTQGTVTSSGVEKEGGFAYLVYTVQYTDSNEEIQIKVVAETLRVTVSSSQFSNNGDCEEHTCDGGCSTTSALHCATCTFKKENGKIIGCDCTVALAYCCHTVKVTSCTE